MSNQQSADLVKTTEWAIADITSMGFFGTGWCTFDLYNRATGRAHTLHVITSGIGVGLPGHGSVSMNFDVDYNYFTTGRPVNFDDFHLRGADVAGANAIFYSATHLNVFDGPNTFGTPKLLSENFSSWGLGLPSVDVMWGVTKLEYGAFGLPRGTPQLLPPEISFPMTPDDLSLHITITQQADTIVLKVPDVVLFGFDKHRIGDIKPPGLKALAQISQIIRKSPKLRSVEVEGHTDSIGSPKYNMDLSLKRANTVLKFLKERTPNIEFRAPTGKGLTQPVAPNDYEVGRQLNRRVEIYLWYR